MRSAIMKAQPIARGGVAALSLLAIALLSPHRALATLGEPEATAEADRTKLGASIVKSEHELYRVQELTLPGGTQVREYVGADGNVFALTWEGRFMPNLRQMLGRYFDVYVAAARNNHADHHHLNIAQSDLVVNASGAMRHFTGRAYLPAAVPAGVSIGELR